MRGAARFALHGCVHDVSRFAGIRCYAEGGVAPRVRRVAQEIRTRKRSASTASRAPWTPRPLYKDVCGLGIIHKSGVPAPPNGDTGTAVSLTNQKRIETRP